MARPLARRSGRLRNGPVPRGRATILSQILTDRPLQARPPTAIERSAPAASGRSRSRARGSGRIGGARLCFRARAVTPPPCRPAEVPSLSGGPRRGLWTTGRWPTFQRRHLGASHGRYPPSGVIRPRASSSLEAHAAARERPQARERLPAADGLLGNSMEANGWFGRRPPPPHGPRGPPGGDGLPVPAGRPALASPPCGVWKGRPFHQAIRPPSRPRALEVGAARTVPGGDPRAGRRRR